MAAYKTPALVRGAEPKRGGSALATVAGLLVVTLLAAGAGAGYALMLAPKPKAGAEAKAEAKPAAAPAYGGTAALKDIPPIIANLASPSEAWVRVELSFLFDSKTVPNPDIVARELSGDIVAFLRTVPLSQLQGPLALQYLREDLNERAAIRTEGRVRELLIQTLVVQ